MCIETLLGMIEKQLDERDAKINARIKADVDKHFKMIDDMKYDA